MTFINTRQSVADIVARLTALDSIYTLTQWERSLLVVLLIGPPPGSGFTYNGAPLTLDEFVDMKVPGLKDKPTIKHYQNAWFTVRDFVPLPEMETVELPTEEFPDRPETVAKREKADATRAMSQASQGVVVAKVAEFLNVPQEEVRKERPQDMRVAEFVNTRAKEEAGTDADKFEAVVEKMIPAVYAEARPGLDVVVENNRARNVNTREWEVRVLGSEHQWQKVADLIAKGHTEAAFSLVALLTDPANPRLDGSEVVLPVLARLDEFTFSVRNRLRGASGSNAA